MFVFCLGMIYMYRASGLHLICVIPAPWDVLKVAMSSYDEEKRDMTLLYIPDARTLSDDTESADTMPFVGERSFVVGMEVCGTPG
jgi:hypothetical protein